jgi:hypothetical protein
MEKILMTGYVISGPAENSIAFLGPSYTVGPEIPVPMTYVSKALCIL